MQRHKSARHVHAARVRWRAAERRAEAERDSGIPDRLAAEDSRQPFAIDLRSAGGPLYRIEPRRGFIAWRAVDAITGEVLHCAALKQLLHWIADRTPRMLAASNFH